MDVEPPKKESEIAMQTFLEDVPPNEERIISGIADYEFGD